MIRTRLQRIYLGLLVLFASPGAASAACAPDMVLTGNPAPIYISELSVSLGESDCPPESLDVSQPVLSQGQRVQFWFRIQGSREYLGSPMSRQPFDVRFFRKDVGRLIFFDAIGVPSVDPRIAAAEAARNQGRFDWRIWVRKRVFNVPGAYVVTVSQGTAEICLQPPGGGRDCAFEFSVR